MKKCQEMAKIIFSSFPAMDRLFADFGSGKDMLIPGKKNGWTRFLARHPSVAGFVFHSRLIGIYIGHFIRNRGKNLQTNVEQAGYRVMKLIHNLGTDLQLRGSKNTFASQDPCVFVSNHQSSLEHNLLMVLLKPFKRATIVSKPGALTYPIFGKIIQSFDPIVVSGNKPREDLVAVFEEGQKRVDEGRSIFLFPAGTRRAVWDPSIFGTMGVKMAKRVKVPLVPVCIRSDFLTFGKRLRELGPVHTNRPVCISVADPLQVEGTGAAQHQACIDYIEAELKGFYKNG